MATMAQHGFVHGDLSAYDLLAAGERLVVIDLPQVVDLVGNPQGMDFLLRERVRMVPEQGPGYSVTPCSATYASRRRSGTIQIRATTTKGTSPSHGSTKARAIPVT
jgi:hypothetical protein